MSKVIILSARAANLIPCVESILQHEPELPRENIIVVDDGAKTTAEARLPALCWLPGMRPFNYARNANLGLQHAEADVILLNDDARLLTPGGFTKWSQLMHQQNNIGLCSAGIRGVVGNATQIARAGDRLRLEPRTLAFVCVFIPQSTFARLGPLDERFSGYGFEDNDYCARCVDAGLHLGVWDGCVVDHSGALASTFRTRPDLWQLFERNRRLFQEKWGARL